MGGVWFKLLAQIRSVNPSWRGTVWLNIINVLDVCSIALFCCICLWFYARRCETVGVIPSISGRNSPSPACFFWCWVTTCSKLTCFLQKPPLSEMNKYWLFGTLAFYGWLSSCLCCTVWCFVSQWTSGLFLMGVALQVFHCWIRSVKLGGGVKHFLPIECQY